MSETELQNLANLIKQWTKELGFQAVGIVKPDLRCHKDKIEQWLAKGYHGTMSFLERNVDMRLNPDLLHPNTVRIISVRMNYLPENARFATNLQAPEQGYISRYAVGRDYHKLMRKRLKQLADLIKNHCQKTDARPFVDSAPVLERFLAQDAGLGWQGKNSLIISPEAGSWFFLGELFINLPLPETTRKQENLCGNCVACLKICPTNAIVAPYTIDSRRCISYLTIEHDGVIDPQLRPLIGNKIYGCDDCQLICPWNKYGQISQETDFQFRDCWQSLDLVELLAWNEQEFLSKTQGSAIRRIGYEKWQRNLAIALGNAPNSKQILPALQNALGKVSPMVDEHIRWAIERQQAVEYAQDKRSQRLINSIKKGLIRDA